MAGVADGIRLNFDVKAKAFAALAPISVGKTAMYPSTAVRIIAKVPVGRRLLLRIWNRLLMHLAPHQVVRTYFGATFECDVRDMIQATIIHFGAWEPRVSLELESLIEPGDVVVDVGANIGYYSLLFADRAGAEGGVVAVEALPKLAAVVEANAVRNGMHNVRVVNVAASDRPGELTLHQAPSTNIGMTTTRSDRGFPATTTVRALPLTEILTDDEIQRTTLIKIDIEGGEVPVVRHFLDNLHRFPKAPAVAVEASVADNSEWADLYCRFVAQGYRAFDLHNDYDWVPMLDFERRAPTALDRLPDTQTDLLFIKHREPASAGAAAS
jgi:FkbM family methyltransferase